MEIRKRDYVVVVNDVEFVLGNEVCECCAGGDLDVNLNMRNRVMIGEDNVNVMIIDFNYVDYQVYFFRVEINWDGYVSRFVFDSSSSTLKDGKYYLVDERKLKRGYLDMVTNY